MSTEGTGYCIDCGAQLAARHRFCWNCGASRWTPDAAGAAGTAGTAGDPTVPPEGPTRPAPEPARPPAEGRPPPIPGTSVFGARPAQSSPPSLGLLPWFYAAGAVFFLIQATQALAQVLSPGARSEFAAELGRQGFGSAAQPGVVTAYWLVLIAGCLVAAGLHSMAFYGLRRRRRWGWIAALVVAAVWSLLIVGIPVLVRLINRSVRQAFGVD